MPYDARAIGNAFLDLSAAESASISPMKLQKLVYFAHGWHLALKDRPLLNEQIEAWDYGPVIPSLYRELREFGNRPITQKLRKSETRGGHRCLREPSLSDLPEEQDFVQALIFRVWEIYSEYSAIQLSNMTHEPETPWSQVHDRYTQNGGRIPKRTDIPTESIRDYFRSRLRPLVQAS